MLVFPETGEVNAVSYPGFKVFTISISNDLVHQFLEQEGIDAKKMAIPNEGIVTPGNRFINDIRHKLEYLIRVIRNNPNSMNTKAFHQIFTREIPFQIMKGALSQNTNQPVSLPNLRKRSMKKAIDYLKESDSEMPTVPELSLIGGASQRTLEYAFKEHYGPNPKEYITLRKLNLINKALKASDPSKTKVKEIAQAHGFWHMGQFSADYKRLFFELPSETLKRDP